MSKRFYVTVPYSPLSDKRKGFWSRFREAFAPVISLRLKETRFRERREALLRRTEHVIANLRSIGLQTAMLDTQGLIELYYTVYNPQIAETQKLGDTNKLQVEE